MPIDLKQLREESERLLKETEELKVQAEELSWKWDERLRQHSAFQIKFEALMNSIMEES